MKITIFGEMDIKDIVADMPEAVSYICQCPANKYPFEIEVSGGREEWYATPQEDVVSKIQREITRRLPISFIIECSDDFFLIHLELRDWMDNYYENKLPDLVLDEFCMDDVAADEARLDAQVEEAMLSNS